MATIDKHEFEQLCMEFSGQKGIGFDVDMVRAITQKAANLCEDGKTPILAMYQALDKYDITKKAERKLYCQVMALYLSRRGYMAKPRKPYETKNDRQWREFARQLDPSSQLQLKFK